MRLPHRVAVSSDPIASWWYFHGRDDVLRVVTSSFRVTEFLHRVRKLEAMTNAMPRGVFSTLSAPSQTFFADLSVTVGAPQEVGSTGQGFRRLIPITGGSVVGDGWTANVLAGGADFQLVVSDRLALLDARYCIQTDGGDLIYVKNRAVRSGPPELMAKLLRGELLDAASTALIYFRCSPTFETASPALSWITERMFTGTGARHPNKVVMRFFALE